MDAPTYRRPTTRFEDLVLQVRRLALQPPAPELLDELAATTDEVLLTLDENRRACGSDGLINSINPETRGVCAHALAREEVAESASGEVQGLARVIRQDKLAA